MNIALWVASGLLALVIMAAGGVKLVVPREKLLERMKWAKTWGDAPFKLLGLAEILGAVGVIVPHATGIAPILTPIAAICLAVLMIGAMRAHLALAESPALPAFLAALAALVALGRFGVF